MCLAIPGKLVAIEGEEVLTRVGRVSFGGIFKDVSLAYLPEARVGDYLLVHAGFALSIVDEEEAHQIFTLLHEMGGLDELNGSEDGSR